MTARLPYLSHWGPIDFQNLFQSLVGGFYHAYGLSMFHSRVFHFESGSSHNFDHDAGCEGSPFVSKDCLRDVGVLSEYLHECVHYSFCVWSADRDIARSNRTPSGCACIHLNGAVRLLD